MRGRGGILIGALLSISACNQGRDALAPSPEPAPSLAAPRAAATSAEPELPGRDCETTADCSWWQDPDPNLVCYGGQCINVARDPRNCGAGGILCAPGQVCAGGVCGEAGPACGAGRCDGGQLCCGGQCLLPIWSTSDCGGCGIACRATGARCQSGNCCAVAPVADPRPACAEGAMCPGSQVRCDDACVDLAADADDCGGCGRACPSDLRRCVAGICHP